MTQPHEPCSTSSTNWRRRYRPIRKLRIVWAGVRVAVLRDFSVLYKLVVSVFVLVPAILLNGLVDAAVIVTVTGLVLSAEVLNTAIESLCDYVQPEHDEQIGIIKDVASAAAGIAIAAWIIVLSVEAIELAGRLSV